MLTPHMTPAQTVQIQNASVVTGGGSVVIHTLVTRSACIGRIHENELMCQRRHEFDQVDCGRNSASHVNRNERQDRKGSTCPCSLLFSTQRIRKTPFPPYPLSSPGLHSLFHPPSPFQCSKKGESWNPKACQTNKTKNPFCGQERTRTPNRTTNPCLSS